MARHRYFSFLMNEVSRRYVERFEQQVRHIGCTLPECRALVRLDGNEGVSQACLASLAGLEPMTLVRALDRLESAGLVERRAHPSDRRVRCLHITRDGRKALERIWSLAEAIRAEVFAGVSAKDRDVFLDVLEHIHRNVLESEDEHPVRAANADRG